MLECVKRTSGLFLWSIDDDDYSFDVVEARTTNVIPFFFAKNLIFFFVTCHIIGVADAFTTLHTMKVDW
jgi:hypothetical protein